MSLWAARATWLLGCTGVHPALVPPSFLPLAAGRRRAARRLLLAARRGCWCTSPRRISTSTARGRGDRRRPQQ